MVQGGAFADFAHVPSKAVPLFQLEKPASCRGLFAFMGKEFLRHGFPAFFHANPDCLSMPTRPSFPAWKKVWSV